MYNTACVASAGRAVLEMIQFDWEPLSHGELDQRLDHAVEEILEADLIEKARALVGSTCLLPSESMQQFQQSELVPQSQQLEFQVSQEQQLQPTNSEEENNAAVKRLSYRSVSSRFRVEKGNIHRIFFSFCERVNALADQQIRWPMGEEAVQNFESAHFLARTEGSENTEIPKVFGILGATRIPIRLPIGKQQIEGGVLEVKKMKKEVHPDSWLNLELVCNCQGKFLHCRISKGSDIDKASVLKEKLKQNPEMMPEGSYLVARSGYPVTGQILTPYPSGCSPRENTYNQAIEAHLDVFDQVVAGLKARFQRLKYLDMGNFDRAHAVVLTACILHNVFLDMGDQDSVFEETQKEERENEGEGEKDEEGVRQREAIADLLYREMEAGRLKCDVRM
ncbi:hypothetical protein JZ751_015116 [Albula glossodonta]|uniref:DDE Tnp4 domain-containing protein n=1 Tax=Albula glossodonta TaxID=121402 RepID=A0A8T2NUI3_9TELE|nr:hypothetical protein JZ751_015116 [Albula glossodonta]